MSIVSIKYPRIISWVLCLAWVVCICSVEAQTIAQKLDPELKMFVKAVRSEDQRPVLAKVTGADRDLVDVYVQGNVGAVRQIVERVGGVVGTVVGDLMSVSLPPSALEEVAGHPAVVRMEQVSEKTVLNDNSVRHAGVLPVQVGASPLTKAYAGQGVLVGIIETGIDFRHLDFRDPHDPSKSRILSFWDQNNRRGTVRPEGFDYGRLWTQAEIEATLAGEDVVGHVDRIGHGTHVTGTAVGNGSALGAHRGVAPEADIIFVNGINRVVDAVQFIINEAERLGRPVAINYSAGDHRGTHDGTSLEEQMLDALIAGAPGRALFVAAGNQGNSFMHWGGFNLSAEMAWTYYRKDVFHTDLIADDAAGFIGPVDGINGVIYNTDLDNTFIAIGVDSAAYVNGAVVPQDFHGQTPWVSLKSLTVVDDVISQTLVYKNGDVAGVVELSGQDLGNGKMAFSLTILDHISSIDTNTEVAVGADFWRLMMRGSGEVHVWSYFTLSAEHPDINLVVNETGYRPTDNRVSVAMPATAKNAIAVGAYVGSVLDGQTLTEGELVVFSSRGPSADGRLKPELTAPGENVISTLSQWAVPERPTTTGLHQWLSGTSMASPVVTGAAALYFQQNPTATFSQLLTALSGQARADAMTGSVPNNDWGYGKLNLFATMSNGASPQDVESVHDLLATGSADGSVASNDDRVVYRLVLDSATELAVDLFPTLLFDPVVDLYRGTSLAYLGQANHLEQINSGGLGTPEKFQRTLKAGHYLLVVSSAGANSLGTFTLRTERQVGLLALGEVVTDRLAAGGDVRTYQLQIDEASDVTVSVVPDSTVRPVMVIYRGDVIDESFRVGRVASEQLGDLSRFESRLSSGTYTLAISASEGTGNYKLSADRFGAIALGQMVDGQLVAGDDVVYHRLDLSEATDMVLSLSPVDENLDVILTLYNGTVISDASQNNWVGFPVDEFRPGWPEHWVGVLDPGYYLVGVSSFRGRSAGAYTLEFDTIRSLSLNVQESGRLFAPNFWDFYRFDLAQDADVVLNLTPDGTLDAVVDVFRGGSLVDAVEENRVGVSLNAGDAGQREGFESRLSTGSYLIWISSLDGSTAGAYTVQVTGEGGVSSPEARADFNQDGQVDFVDYLNFAKQFGSATINPGFDARFDLDDDGSIGFSDFVLFVQSFGKQVG